MRHSASRKYIYIYIYIYVSSKLCSQEHVSHIKLLKKLVIFISRYYVLEISFNEYLSFLIATLYMYLNISSLPLVTSALLLHVRCMQQYSRSKKAEGGFVAKETLNSKMLKSLKQISLLVKSKIL